MHFVNFHFEKIKIPKSSFFGFPDFDIRLPEGNPTNRILVSHRAYRYSDVLTEVSHRSYLALQNAVHSFFGIAFIGKSNSCYLYSIVVENKLEYNVYSAEGKHCCIHVTAFPVPVEVRSNIAQLMKVDDLSACPITSS